MAYEAEIGRSIERVVVDRLMDAVVDARMPQVRAIAQAALNNIVKMGGSDPHRALMAQDIQRFNARPSTAPLMTTPTAPPGAPIGDPGMSYLWRLVEPFCSQDSSPFGSLVDRPEGR